MSFHYTSNIKYNFGFYVAHGWSISNLCSVVSNTYPSLQPNSFPADLQAPHCSHLHTFHFSPLLPDLITSFTGWNSISNVLLSKIQSNCLVSSISPTYSLNSYFPSVQGNYIQKAPNNSRLPKYAISSAHICDCTYSSKGKVFLLCFLHLNNLLVSRSHSQWLFLHKPLLIPSISLPSVFP